jgi:hypothetical protein
MTSENPFVVWEKAKHVAGTHYFMFPKMIFEFPANQKILGNE